MDHNSTMTSAAIPAGTVEGKLNNSAVTPAQRQLQAGEVTFVATHDPDHMDMATEGGATHERIVRSERTRQPPFSRCYSRKT